MALKKYVVVTYREYEKLLCSSDRWRQFTFSLQRRLKQVLAGFLNLCFRKLDLTLVSLLSLFRMSVKS
jgi:hypothetical protein